MDIEKERVLIEEKLMIPITNLEFTENKCVILSKGNQKILDLEYSITNKRTNYNITTETLQKLNWGVVLEENKTEISSCINRLVSISTSPPTSNENYKVKVSDVFTNISYTLTCYYIHGQWKLDFDDSTKLTLLTKNISSLENRVQALSNQGIVQQDPLSNLVETAMKHGTPIISEWLKSQNTSSKIELEKATDFEKQELESIKVLDRRDKLFKFSIIFICIGALTFLAIYDRASSIAPVIGVIIGLVLQANVISEYFSGALKKRKIDHFDEQYI
jgi:hypothetical protein